MRPDELETRLRQRLDALGLAPRAELLRVLMLPDFERADRIGEFWGYPETRTFGELLIGLGGGQGVQGSDLGTAKGDGAEVARCLRTITSHGIEPIDHESLAVDRLFTDSSETEAKESRHSGPRWGELDDHVRQAQATESVLEQPIKHLPTASPERGDEHERYRCAFAVRRDATPPSESPIDEDRLWSVSVLLRDCFLLRDPLRDIVQPHGFWACEGHVAQHGGIVEEAQEFAVIDRRERDESGANVITAHEDTVQSSWE